MNDLKRTGTRVVIRTYILSDYEEWKKAMLGQRPKQNEWDKGPSSEENLTLAKFKALLRLQKKNRDEDRTYSLSIFHKKSGALIGNVALMDVSRGLFQNAYLGYNIFNTHWRQGYGKEAVKLALDLGFDELKLHRIEAGIDPQNKRSLYLARTLGMRREGKKSRALFINNQWVDIMIYALTVEDLGKKFRGKINYVRSA